LPTGVKLLNLNGKKFYKVSHGIFRKNFRHTEMATILEKNNWVCLHADTGKGAGNEFEHNVEIGDFVYVCYGGDDLYCVGKIISDAHYLDAAYNTMIDGDGKWIYREIERFFMPSGNSTFYEVPTNQLDYMNDSIFIPKVGLRIIDSSVNKLTIESTITTPSPSINWSMNSILFGPPGTGKTFHSISHAVAIVENEPLYKILAEVRADRAIVKDRFDQYVEKGQIVFCTFHQSLSYEDFIEGIKPVEPNEEEDERELTYAVEDGLFKRLCTEAAFSFVTLNPTSDIETVLDFSSDYDRFIDSVNERFSKGEKVELEAKNGGNVCVFNISSNNNIWVKHINGERKYTVSKNRLSKLAQAFPDLKDVVNINDEFRAEIGGSNSSAYWAVLNAIRQQSPVFSAKGKSVSAKEYTYEDKKAIIKTLKNEDYKSDNPKKFVLIVDEINRGNVSQIFGELITLIEDDKRLGKEESLSAKLPYSKHYFGVPPNVFIIGTMNTADRSVEALDTALRRRFSFVPMSPKPEELKPTTDGINLTGILRVLNNRLTILKDSDHTIGHAWLWNVTDIEVLKIAFRDKILPLLQEYFYNDFEKLGLVLGDRFFKPHVQVNSNIFASFTGGNGLAGQYDQSWQYELKPVEDLTIADFKSLENLTNLRASNDE
jgi:hypothetical protein